MEFKNYKLKLLLRVGILIIGLLALVYSAIILKSFMRTLFSVIFSVLSVFELFQFLNRMNNDFKYFINALLYEDFSSNYKSGKEENMFHLFNRLNSKYQKIAFEKEVQFALIQTIIQNVSLGIIVSDENENIELINDYLLKLFKCNKLKKLVDLTGKFPQLKDKFYSKSDNKPELIEISIDGEFMKLSVNISKFKLKGKNYSLISVQNINIELDEHELVAWQKLIRVLTHEIMNSVTPISSLSSSLNRIVTNTIQDQKIDKKNLDYLTSGLSAVQERSEGLIKFTESYKKLTQLKHPEYSKFSAKNLLEGVFALYKSEIERKDLEFEINCSDNLNLYADKSMIEQVLINLVKNSIESLNDNLQAYIHLNCFIENEHLTIQIVDNGKGIASDKIDKIFIPFFTTKEGGSGIGLSFARQVMRLHRANIFVKSSKEKTVFTLKF